MKNNQVYNCFNKLAKCNATACVTFLTFILFLFVIISPLNACDSGVCNLKMNKKYYFHLDGVNIFKIGFKKDNTFSMRKVPVRSSIFNCRRYGKITGIYFLCKDNIKLFWFIKRAKDMILYEVDAIFFRKDMIKALSLKETKCN